MLYVDAIDGGPSAYSSEIRLNVESKYPDMKFEILAAVVAI